MSHTIPSGQSREFGDLGHSKQKHFRFIVYLETFCISHHLSILDTPQIILVHVDKFIFFSLYKTLCMFVTKMMLSIANLPQVCKLSSY